VTRVDGSRICRSLPPHHSISARVCWWWTLVLGPAGDMLGPWGYRSSPQGHQATVAETLWLGRCVRCRVVELRADAEDAGLAQMLLDQLGPGGVNEVMTRISNLTVALVLATKAQWASQEREAVLRQEKAVHVQRIKTAEEDQAKMSQQMTELLQALEAQLAKLRVREM
jgi:hypothetical protein